MNTMNSRVIFYKINILSHSALSDVLSGIIDECRRADARAAVISADDCPFINEGLTNELIERHFKYAAEYTFADGYPEGLTPEVLDAGSANILLTLSRTTQKAMGDAPMTRTAIWDLIKTDVNAFEVETLIAPRDYRLWRLAFHTGDKRGLMACEALERALGKSAAEIAKMDACEVCEAAIKDIRQVRTVPAFYQVFDAMPLDKFSILVPQIKALSGDAVVSIDTADTDYVSLLSKAGLDVLIETGEVPSEDIVARCHDIDPNIRWIIDMTPDTSAKHGSIQSPDGGHFPNHGSIRPNGLLTNHGSIRPNGLLTNHTATAADALIAILHRYFPGGVYPRLVRTTDTEPQLEAFYRKWSAADSPSGGKVLITKYCSYCGTLPDLKPADLSPLERNPCWHLRRDMTILADGTVPLCFARVNSLKDEGNILGNAFTDGLATLWNKMEPYAEKDLQYCLAATPLVTVDSDRKNSSPSLLSVTASDSESDDLCRKCDEYYTFNF